MAGKSLTSVEEDTTSRISKVGYSFMEKRHRCRVIEETMDVTPDDVVSPKYAAMFDTFSHAAFEVRVRRVEATLKSTSTPGDAMKVFATTINLDDIHIDHTQHTEEGIAYDEVDLEKAPSAFCLPKVITIMSYPPEVTLVFKETPTVMLFELPTFSYEKGSDMANIVEEENEFYQYITVGKGRNRKMVVEETQTEPVVSQSRHTNAVRPDKRNASAFASLWDMHDTYAKLSHYEHKEEPDEMVLYQSADPVLLRKKKSSEISSKGGITFEDVRKMHNFYDAAMLIERVLAVQDYCTAQKRFRGLIRSDPLALDLVYIYTMKPLWTLECEETENRPITSISFNPKNENIMAVAYGKYGYAESFNGLICIWCTKNPCKPERTYKFDNPLTSVAFSECNPNWLAAGFANGDVVILDITFYRKKLIAESTRDSNPCFEPIWSINWRKIDARTEFVMTSCQDGRINKFKSTKSHDFICTLMMRISTVEGKMKGLQTAKMCLRVDVPITRYPAALCMRWHPYVDHVYLVGTDEGCIHRCSKHYLNQHMDVYRAHAGPVYAMDYSPFMPTLLMTCGADGAIRLWMENMDDVIMTLNCPYAVNGVAFCPINSTIIISVSGHLLSIWDLRRKNHIPCAEYTFPGSVILTFIKFSTSGENVFIGDSIGRIHTFHLEDTPLPPFYQRKMLEDAVKKALCTRPHMLKQLSKLTAANKHHHT